MLPDTLPGSIRSPDSGQPAFQAMTVRNIYTIAGDGGPATATELEVPEGVAVDPAGNVLIDDGSARIRMVTG